MTSDEMPTLVLMDGSCGRCRRAVRFCQPRVDEAVEFVDAGSLLPEQLGAFGVDRADVERSLWVIEHGRASEGVDAISVLLRHFRRQWPLLGRLLAVRPVAAVARPLYVWQASRRRRDVCVVEGLNETSRRG